METSFDFSDRNAEYIYSLHPKSEIILHIKRIHKTIATLYFTNQLNKKIEVPSDFIVYKNNEIQDSNINNHEYSLLWNKNYDIVYNGETLFNIRNERKWTIYN